MITTVSLNPAIDKTILLSDFKHGGVNRITSVREDIGGKGINVAKILNRLKVPVQSCGFIGTKNKRIVLELLASEELSHDFLDIEGMTRTNTKIVELDRIITTDLNEPGFFIEEAQQKEFHTLLCEKAEHSDYIVFSGSIPMGLAPTTYQELILSVRDHAKTILDADGQLLLEGMKSGPYMIKPNLHELETAFEVTLSTKEDILSFCKALLLKYDIQIILVSMGEKGSLLITREECYQAEPIKVDVKSTVGAGDSMIAGMLYGIAHNMPLSQSFAFAAASGTLAVTKEGTQSFSLEELQEMLHHVHIINL
jgi:1-phosphofructokinase